MEYFSHHQGGNKMSPFYIALQAISIGVNWITAKQNRKQQETLSELNRKQQEEIADKNRQLTIDIENNRQAFNLELHEKNAALQRELSKLNHNFRIHEQLNNFDLLCKKTEFDFLLSQWPLVTPPMVMKDEVLSDINESVSLRLILSESQDLYFNQNILKSIDHAIHMFINDIYNTFNSHPVIYYSNGWKSSSKPGGAMNQNIFYLLKGFPTLIIVPNVINNKLKIDIALWGLGASKGLYQTTIYEVPFEKHLVNGKLDIEKCEEFINSILPYFYSIISWIADSYYLIEYNEVPLLPNIIKKNITEANKSSIHEFIKEQYSALYDYTLSEDNSIALSSDSKLTLKETKLLLIPELRANYAEKLTCSFYDKAITERILRESLEAWLYFRTNKLINQKISIDTLIYEATNMASYKDINYLSCLRNCYKNLNNPETYNYLRTTTFKLAQKKMYKGE